jgi:hypothetical protein
MQISSLIQYLEENGCYIDPELCTDEFYVLVNSTTLRVAQVVKDTEISSHTCVVLFRALSILCHGDLEDYDAVLQAHEHSQQQKRVIFPDRLN